MISPKLKWWIGVVEDRADPEQIGRYRVRVLGYHTANRVTLPTEDLPWATCVMPVNSPGISGIGQNPMLVEGSTVIGFFADGDDEQQPIIVGSYMGFPMEREENPEIGFNDPFHTYPLNGEQEGRNTLNEPDTSRLARGAKAEEHYSLLNKRGTKVNEIPRALASSVPSVSEDLTGATYERETWDEPHPRFGSTDAGTYTTPGEAPTFEDGTTSVYPYNNVWETESGHVFEVDDTPGNGRIHNYHNSGTFEEIQADGKKVTKIVGDEYEITLKNRKVYIAGNCDVTIAGNAKMYVKGDMYTEVDGNQFNTIRGNRVTKIGGNDLTEVLSDSATQINGNKAVRVSKDDSETITGAQTHTVGKTKTTTVTDKVVESHNASMTTVVSGAYNIVSVDNLSLGTGANLSMAAEEVLTATAGGESLIKSTGSMTLESTGSTQAFTASGSQTLAASVTNIQQDTNITGTSTASVDHVSKNISGVGHTHREQGDNADVSAPK